MFTKPSLHGWDGPLSDAIVPLFVCLYVSSVATVDVNWRRYNAGGLSSEVLSLTLVVLKDKKVVLGPGLGLEG